VTYWISKTHVKIEQSEMTREEALEMARELLTELSPAVKQLRAANVEWTPGRDEELKALREAGVSVRQIAYRMLGDAAKFGSISSRITRLGLPAAKVAQQQGRALAVARLVSLKRKGGEDVS
jgi:hypothetical protein